MAKNKPPTDVLSDEDVLFFYKEILSRPEQRINKNIITIAKNLGVKVDFINLNEKLTNGKNIFPKPKTFYPKKENTIFIYDKNTGSTKSFLEHCRNAFVHQYVKIENDTLQMLDWNPYMDDGKKKKFSFSRLTMHGNVNYTLFKKIIN